MDKKPHKFLLKSGHFISSTLSLRTQLYTPWQTPAIALSPYPNHCHLFGSTKPDRVVSEFKELPSHFFQYNFQSQNAKKQTKTFQKGTHTSQLCRHFLPSFCNCINFSQHNFEREHSKFLQNNWEAPGQRNSARFPWFSQFCHSIGTF